VSEATAAAKPGTPPIPKVWLDKFGHTLMAGGYTVVPNTIVRRYKQLPLDATGFSLVMQLLSYWWNSKDLPFPSMLELSKGAGIHVRNVQKRLQQMQKDGWIKIKKRKTRHGGWDSNAYDLSGLVKEMTKIAAEDAAKKKATQLATIGKKTPPKGKPPLKVVKT